jgi:Domain of unknown function (DUF3786)
LLLTFDKNEVQGLKRLAGKSCIKFLGYVLNLDSMEISDSLTESGNVDKLESEILYVILSHYAESKPMSLSGTLVKFADLPGGGAYEQAFQRCAAQPVAEAFGDKPEKLVECGERLGGRRLTFGDCSMEFSALPHVPLTFIVWQRWEFPAEASVLFDKSASHYLPTEDLAVLGELTSARLLGGFIP